IYGRATLAMLVSSTSMNAASATTTAISQGLYLGRQTSCSRVRVAELIPENSSAQSWLRPNLLNQTQATELTGDKRPVPRSCRAEADDLYSPPHRERSSLGPSGQFSHSLRWHFPAEVNLIADPLLPQCCPHGLLESGR